MIGDTKRDDMARELAASLVRAGCDPKNPPLGSKPPAVAAFNEYVRRGGINYNNSDEFMKDLVKRTGEV